MKRIGGNAVKSIQLLDKSQKEREGRRWLNGLNATLPTLIPGKVK